MEVPVKGDNYTEAKQNLFDEMDVAVDGADIRVKDIYLTDKQRRFLIHQFNQAKA